VETGDALTSPRGRITIAGKAIAQIVGYATAECAGVVGMDGTAVERLLPRGSPTRGVEVRRTPDGVEIALHVVVEHGLNLAEVAATIRSRVAYEVERLTGLNVAAVEVHISDVRK
jgi:uncharacterized alkaline shock family protein YloU